MKFTQNNNSCVKIKVKCKFNEIVKLYEQIINLKLLEYFIFVVEL